MVTVRDNKECCGCSACGDVCTSGAISFVSDKGGYLSPEVDQDKCTRCGACLRVCPIVHKEEFVRESKEHLHFFAAVHKNFSVLFDSAAGGAFTALANVVYRQGGLVGGAIWTEDFRVRHMLSRNKSDLPLLRGIKYPQSDARGFFKAVHEAVETGSIVLASGTPCQMASLRLCFGNKSPDNLYLVDFVCTGSISPVVWHNYLSEQEAKAGGKLIGVQVMNKEYSWDQRTIKLIFKNKHIAYNTRMSSPFTMQALRGEYSREACHGCTLRGIPHVADITLAECVDNKFLDPCGRTRDIGCTLVIIHTPKGEDLWNKAKDSTLFKELTWQEASADNPLLDNKKSSVIRSTSFVLRFKHMLRLAVRTINLVGSRPGDLIRLVRDNGILRILRQQPVIAAGPKVRLNLKGKVILRGKFILARVEAGLRHAGSSIFVHPEGELVVNGETEVGRGAEIEVLRGGKLVFDGGTRFNTGGTISCATYIKIGKGVMAGPNVTIRDNNGTHWINLPSYRNAKPVEIGEHAWLCEGSTVMPGVKIGAGAIVGAHAVVFSNVPPNTMVVGNPAEVVCEDVKWKY